MYYVELCCHLPLTLKFYHCHCHTGFITINIVMVESQLLSHCDIIFWVWRRHFIELLHTVMAWVIATLGPNWEFQPCLKSCNLASWTTKWHDYARGTSRPTTHPPTPALVENLTFMQYRRLEFGGCLKGVWTMSKMCLEGVWLLSAMYREGVWRVLRRCLTSLKFT